MLSALLELEASEQAYALKELQKAINIAPNKAIAYLLRGEILNEVDKDRALADFERASANVDQYPDEQDFRLCMLESESKKQVCLRQWKLLCEALMQDARMNRSEAISLMKQAISLYKKPMKEDRMDETRVVMSTIAKKNRTVKKMMIKPRSKKR